jgi:hypothetical protein
MEIKHSLNACLSGRQGYQPPNTARKTNTNGLMLAGTGAALAAGTYNCIFNYANNRKSVKLIKD